MRCNAVKVQHDAMRCNAVKVRTASEVQHSLEPRQCANACGMALWAAFGQPFIAGPSQGGTAPSSPSGQPLLCGAKPAMGDA